MLGLIGSLHCAGMCGPLALALPRVGNTPAAFFAGRLLYNAGRITTYCLIGLAAGTLGAGLAMAGFQSWLSLAAGAVLLLAAAGAALIPRSLSPWRALSWLRRTFGSLLQRRSRAALFSLGVLNGLLPCGLVYVAAATVMVSGGLAAAVGGMAAFGLGTLPVMLGIPLAGGRVGILARFNSKHLLPATIALAGILLVLRGMELGIPYLSPVSSSLHSAVEIPCH